MLKSPNISAPPIKQVSKAMKSILSSPLADKAAWIALTHRSSYPLGGSMIPPVNRHHIPRIDHRDSREPIHIGRRDTSAVPHWMKSLSTSGSSMFFFFGQRFNNIERTIGIIVFVNQHSFHSRNFLSMLYLNLQNFVRLSAELMSSWRRFWSFRYCQLFHL